MKRLPLVLLALVIGSSARAKDSIPDTKKPLFIAHYMAWFGLPETSGDWYQWKFAMEGVGIDKHHYPDLILANGRRDIAAIHYPSIGPYDSTDPNLCEYHILLAKEAGIDGFMVNWYGFEHSKGGRRQEDRGFEQLLKAAEKLDFKVCLNFDDKSAFPPYWDFKTRRESVAYANKIHLEAMKRYAASPAYLKIDKRPVLSNFSSAYPTTDCVCEVSFTPAEHREMLKALKSHDPYFIHDHQWDWRRSVKEAGYADISDSIFSWVGTRDQQLAFLDESRQLLKKRRIRMITGIANPGFDNSACWGWGGGLSRMPRNGGKLYSDGLEDCLAYGAGFIHLVTWNDYTEGSTIEPTEEYGDKYLRLTAQYSRRWNKDYGRLLRFDLPAPIYRDRTRRANLNPDLASSARNLAQISRLIDQAVVKFTQTGDGETSALLTQAEALIQSEESKMPRTGLLEVSLNPPSQDLFIGETGQVRVKIKNPSKEIVPVYLELNRKGIPRSWMGDDLESKAWLSPGEEKEFAYTVRVATDAGETIGWFTARVDSPYIPVTSNVSYLHVYRPVMTGGVEPVNLLRPGMDEKLELVLDLKQKRARKAKIMLSAPDGWTARADPGEIELPRSGQLRVPLTVRAPDNARDPGMLAVRVVRDDGEEFDFKEPFGILRPGDAALLEGDLNQDGVMDYALGNAFVEVHVTQALGGRILSIIRRDSGNNQLYLDYPRTASTQGDTWDKWAEYGGINDWFPAEWPGKVWNNDWKAKVLERGGSSVAVVLASRADEQLRIEKEIRVDAAFSSVKVSYEIANDGDVDRAATWTNHPDFTPGSTAGKEDLIVIPVSDRAGLARKSYEPRMQKSHFIPSENWVLAHDSKNREFLGEVFDNARVEKVGVWEGSGFFTMELIFNKMLLPPRSKKDFTVEYVTGRGELESAIRKMKDRAAEAKTAR